MGTDLNLKQIEDIMNNDLPPHPPKGKKRWKVVLRDPKENPFRSRHGASRYTQTVDLDQNISRDQVETWAQEAAKGLGYEFLELQAVA